MQGIVPEHCVGCVSTVTIFHDEASNLCSFFLTLFACKRNSMPPFCCRILLWLWIARCVTSRQESAQGILFRHRGSRYATGVLRIEMLDLRSYPWVWRAERNLEICEPCGEVLRSYFFSHPCFRSLCLLRLILIANKERKRPIIQVIEDKADW